MSISPLDFESSASTNFTTPAWNDVYSPEAPCQSSRKRVSDVFRRLEKHGTEVVEIFYGGPYRHYDTRIDQ